MSSTRYKGIKNMSTIDKAYVSPIDRFLFEFDAAHEKSASQLAEIKKHEKIAVQRDNAKHSTEKQEIWEEF